MMIPAIIQLFADIIIWTNTLGKQPIVAVCKELGYNFCGEYLWAKRTSAGNFFAFLFLICFKEIVYDLFISDFKLLSNEHI